MHMRQQFETRLLGGSVAHAELTCLFGAMCAAVILPMGLHAVAENSAMAMTARWGERMNCTFEAVERVHRATDQDVEALVVFVPAQLARGHVFPPWLSGASDRDATVGPVNEQPVRRAARGGLFASELPLDRAPRLLCLWRFCC